MPKKLNDSMQKKILIFFSPSKYTECFDTAYSVCVRARVYVAQSKEFLII
jgi:hypothetical protein